jgi:superfamily II DNA or RNA helicase
MSGYLTPQGFFVPLGTLRAKFGRDYDTLLKKLTIRQAQLIGRPKITRMYSEGCVDGRHIMFLPRTLLAIFMRRGIISQLIITLRPYSHMVQATTDVGATGPGPLRMELYTNQTLIVDHLMHNIYTPSRMSDGSACAILNLRAGMGKTFIAAAIIAKLGLNTLYIAPKRPVAAQATVDLRRALTMQILEHGARPCHILTPPYVTVIVINSALLQSDEFFAQYQLIIYDEVHMYCSAKRKDIFKRCAWAGLGMSATTSERADACDVISHKELAFDGVIHADTLPGFTFDDVVFSTSVHVLRYHGPPEYTQRLTHDSTGYMFCPYMNKQFISDPWRMQLAINRLRSLWAWRGQEGQQHRIYVFCEELDPLDQLAEALQKIDVVYTPELVGRFVGGIKNDAAQDISHHARIILTTYGYAGTGISIPDATAILFLTPRKAGMLQILARILRRGGDLSITREIIDIVDVCTPVKKQYHNRKMGYDYYGMTVLPSDIYHDDILIDPK